MPQARPEARDLVQRPDAPMSPRAMNVDLRWFHLCNDKGARRLLECLGARTHGPARDPYARVFFYQVPGHDAPAVRLSELSCGPGL